MHLENYLIRQRGIISLVQITRKELKGSKYRYNYCVLDGIDKGDYKQNQSIDESTSSKCKSLKEAIQIHPDFFV